MIRVHAALAVTLCAACALAAQPEKQPATPVNSEASQALRDVISKHGNFTREEHGEKDRYQAKATFLSACRLKLEEELRYSGGVTKTSSTVALDDITKIFIEKEFDYDACIQFEVVKEFEAKYTRTLDSKPASTTERSTAAGFCMQNMGAAIMAARALHGAATSCGAKTIWMQNFDRQTFAENTGPSYEETFRWLQSTLRRIGGQLGTGAHGTLKLADPIPPRTLGCLVLIEVEQSPNTRTSSSFFVRTVARDRIRVEPMREGHCRQCIVLPQSVGAVLETTWKGSEFSSREERQEATICVDDATMAERLEKAFLHMADLCGANDMGPEPF